MNYRLQQQNCNVINPEMSTSALPHSRYTTAAPYASALELYGAIFEQAADGILVLDQQGWCQDINHQACQMLGGAREELLPLALPDLLRNALLPQEGLRFPELPTDAPLTAEVPLRSKDGRLLWVEMRTQRLANGYRLAFMREITERRHLVQDSTERKQAAAALRTTEEQLRALVDISAQIVWTTNAQGAIEEDSPSWRAFTGQSYAEWVSNGWQKMVHPDDRPLVIAKWQEAVTTGAPFMSEHRMWHRRGEWRWTLARAVPLRNNDGTIRAWVGMNTDVTKRKQVETAWRELTENMAAAQRIAHFGSWEVNLTADLQFDEPYLWSDECYRIFGFEPASFAVTNDRYFRSIHPDDYARFMEIAQRDLHEGRNGSYEYRIIRPDGSIRYIHEQSLIVLDEQTQRPRKLVGMSHDITTRKMAENALRAEQERLKQIAATVPGVIYVFRQQSDCAITPIYTSPGITAFIGTEAAEINDVSQLFTWVHPEDLPTLYTAMTEGAQTLKKQTIEYRVLLPDRSILWMESIAVPERDADGSVLWYGFITDITERKRAQEQLHYQANLLQNVTDAIIATDLNFHITNWNQGAETLYGWRAEEVMGKRLGSIIPSDYMGEPEEKVLQDFWTQGLWKGEVVQQQRTGVKLNVMASVSVIKDSAGNAIGTVGVNRDISQRKQIEEALRQSEERLKLALATTQMGVWEWDVAADTVFWSPECYAIFGQAYFGNTLHDFTALVAPEDVNDVMTTLHEALANQTMYSAEFRITRPNGESGWVYNLGRATYDKRGKPLRMIGIVQEITERKRAEEAQATLEDQLRQAQKMETVGRLAGGVAHDFNNLLTVIQGYCDLLLAKMASDSPLRGKLEQIQKAGKRASALTGQLLAFSRKQMLSPTVLDLNNLVTNLQVMLGRLIGEDITLATVLQPGLWSVTADPSQLEQVIMNLVVNARDAMPTGGRLTIETANLQYDQVQFHTKLGSTQSAVLSGPCVMLAVTDTGCGMNEETQTHMFEPFFTTKELGKGTGLGLATVYGIIKQSGGDIFVYSEPGHGSTFKIYLPANAEMIKPQIANFAPTIPERGHETILLVEDEEMVCRLVQAALEDKGYTILEAHYASEALAIANQYPGTIDLLMTDVVMPQMSGRALAERLVVLRPELKVLFTSGYTDDSVVRHGLLTAEVEFLPKPFSPRALAHKVREVLDK